MHTITQVRWFQVVFVTAVLLNVSIGLPHGRGDVNTDNNSPGHLEKRDTSGDDHEEHESQVFINNGKAHFYSRFGPTGKVNIDEMGLDPNAHAGDILYEDDNNIESDQISKRKAVTRSYRLWPNGIVPWYFDSLHKFRYQSSRDKIWDAIYYWQNMTCLRFPYRNTDTQHVRIGTGYGCSSAVGRYWTAKPQPITLQERGCMSKGIIVHEIGHAIGFNHEQTRSDRDNFIEILWQNIADRKEGNFVKKETSVVVEYDLESVMHYGLRSFSKNGQPVIKVKRQELSFLAGSRNSLTFYDAKLANVMYNCADGCTNTCHNHGYPFKTPGGQCVCKCPPFLTGDCNTVDSVTTDYPSCGGVYELKATNPTVTIHSPNYPANYDVDTLCVYVIKAPEGSGKGVKLTFSDFHVTAGPYHCPHFVQINANLIGQKGVKYCGSSANSPDVVHTFLDHDSSEMMVIFNSKDTNAATAKGFRFTATLAQASEFTTQPPSTTATPEGQISCSFDDGDLCGWTQATDDDFNWTSHSGKTPTKGTGPVGGDKNTRYIYTEVSTVSNYAKARISTNYFPAGHYCFSFKWHMKGSTYMGELALSKVTKNDIESVLFRKSGHQSNAWQFSEINIVVSEETKLAITGTKGTSGKGDIALDSFVMRPQACPKLPLACDFEDFTLCSFNNDPDADFKWKPINTRTPSSYTGPSAAKSGSVYVYAEASGRSYDDVARLVLPPSKAYATPFCLKWWYHMYGFTMGTLNVLVVDTNGNKENIWQKYRSQGDKWYQASVHVNRNDIIQVVFEARMGVSYGSDIALDLIQMNAASAC